MDPETALQLVKHGATILLLDVPQYTLIGIDTQVSQIKASSVFLFVFLSLKKFRGTVGEGIDV